MIVTVKSDSPKLAAILRDMEASIARSAQASALNRTAKYVQREAIRKTATSTGVPATILRKRIAVPRGTKATSRSLRAQVFGGLWSVPVSKLKPAPRKLKSGTVKYKTMPGDIMRRDAFIGTTKSGATRVFVRKGPARLPISSVTADIGPHVRRSIESSGSSVGARDYYRNALFKEMDRAIRGKLIRMGVQVR